MDFFGFDGEAGGAFDMGAADLFTETGIEKVLAQDEFTLEELLDQEEIVQEVRGYNEKLLDFLTQPGSLACLVSYIADARWPENDNEKESFRYPYIAAELFCCNNPQLTSALLDGAGACLPSPAAGFATRRAAQHALQTGTVDSMRHIHRLLAVVDAGVPVPEYRVSYATRVVSSVAGGSPLRLMAAVARCPFPLAKRCLQHAHVQATGELMKVLMALPWPEGCVATSSLCLSEADAAQGGAGGLEPIPEGLLQALGGDVGGSWLAVSHSEALAAAETAHGVLAACVERCLVAPTDDFKTAHSFSRQPIRSASGQAVADSAPSPFAGEVSPLTRAHAGSRLDPALYGAAPSASLHASPAAQCVKALLHGQQEAKVLVQAVAHSVCQPAPEAAGGGRPHLAAPLKPAAVPAALRSALAERLQVQASAFDTLWARGDWALGVLASLLGVAARVSGGLLATADGRTPQAQEAAPALVSLASDAVPLLCSHLHALCDAAEAHASALPPASAGPSSRSSRVGKATVCKEAHHLPRLGALSMGVVRVLAAWLACRWPPRDAATPPDAWIALLRLVRFFPWASLLHQEVARAAEAVLVQGTPAAQRALVVGAKLPQWILKRSNEQRLLTDCSKPFAPAPALTVGYVPQMMVMAQCAEAARLAGTLPVQVCAAFDNDAWRVFVGGALTTHILRQSVTLGGPVPSGKNLSGDTGDLKVDEVPAAAGV